MCLYLLSVSCSGVINLNKENERDAQGKSDKDGDTGSKSSKRRDTIQQKKDKEVTTKTPPTPGGGELEDTLKRLGLAGFDGIHFVFSGGWKGDVDRNSRYYNLKKETPYYTNCASSEKGLCQRVNHKLEKVSDQPPSNASEKYLHLNPNPTKKEESSIPTEVRNHCYQRKTVSHIDSGDLKASNKAYRAHDCTLQVSAEFRQNVGAQALNPGYFFNLTATPTAPGTEATPTAPGKDQVERGIVKQNTCTVQSYLVRLNNVNVSVKNGSLIFKKIIDPKSQSQIIGIFHEPDGTERIQKDFSTLVKPDDPSTYLCEKSYQRHEFSNVILNRNTTGNHKNKYISVGGGVCFDQIRGTNNLVDYYKNNNSQPKLEVYIKQNSNPAATFYKSTLKAFMDHFAKDSDGEIIDEPKCLGVADDSTYIARINQLAEAINTYLKNNPP